jgi:hypothetical protein
MNKIKQAGILVLLLLTALSATGKDITVKAPPVVAVNAMFNISYVVDAGVDEIATFAGPASFADLAVIAGPARSYSSSHVFDGKTTKSETHTTYTYTVKATKEGVFDIAEAEINFKDGTTLKSKKVSVEAIKDKPATGNSADNTGDSKSAPGGVQQRSQASGNFSPEDLFVRMEVNKNSVYKGDPFILSIKLYSHNVPVTQITNFQMPTLAGFDMQELTVAESERQLRQQKYNNRVYGVATIARVMLYPLRAGDIRIDPLEIGVAVQVRQQTRSNDIFDMFIGPMVSTVTKQLKSAPVTLHIKDFPAGAPATFNGATGSFTLSSKIDKTSVTANQPVSYSLTISGTGNFKQVKEPLVVISDKFDKYDPKITDNSKITASGGSGSKRFEYVLIPRSAGEFDIPPIEFSYFDTQKGAYVTLKSDPVHLEVAKDPNASNSQPITSQPVVAGKKVEHIGNDILFIKTGALTLKPGGYVFFASSQFWLILLAITAAFAVACVLIRKMLKNRQNVALVRNKKANKVAVNRLKLSSKYLKAGDHNAFYDEVSKAIWGYIGDKLNMQSSELSRDNVQEKLAARKVPTENIDLLISVIDRCEYARYAPSANNRGMEDVYSEAVNAISKLEDLR